MQNKKTLNAIMRTPIILVILLVYLAPFYILTTISFKPVSDLSSYWKFPSVLTFDNFRVAIQDAGILQSLMRTAIITVFVVVLVVVISAFTAYPLARRSNKLNQFISTFVLGVMMVPPLSILVSLYSVVVDMGGVNKYWAIILVMLTYQLPQGIFLYTNFIRAIPKALDEAAAIDGCSPAKTFFLIILPQLKPVTTSVIILAGINCWNDYQFSRYILQATDMNTATLSIASFFSQTYSDLNSAAAAAMISILPVVVAFLFLQKYFIQGMIDSAIK